MNPLHAKHVDADGKVMAVIATEYNFQLNDWLRGLRIQPGDKIEFEPLHVRKEEEVQPALSAVA